MDNVYRKIILGCCLFLLLYCPSSYSQDGFKTVVKLTDLSDEVLLNKMQRNATELLTGINEAFFQNRKPEIRNDVMTDKAKEILNSLWETSPLRCTETQIIERVLQMKREKKYQIRNIPVFIKDVFSENEAKSKEVNNTSDNYEICLTFNSTGKIEIYAIHFNQIIMRD
jgi:hypothetical protein